MRKRGERDERNRWSRARRWLVGVGAAVSSFFIVSAVPALAQINTSVGDNIALSDRSPVQIALYLISWFLGILAIIAVVLIIYGGWLWMTSNGSEEKVERAKQVLRNALIGLVIILSAWGIVLYVLGILSDATGTSTTTGGGPGSGCPTCVIPTGGSDFYVTATVPAAGETDVFLCYAVSVSMTKNIDRATVTDDTFTLRIADGSLDGASCVTNDQCASGVCSDSGSCVGDNVAGEFAYVGDASRQFDFLPDNDLLSDETYEAVVVGGSGGVRSETGLSTVSYDWTFTTGTDTDEIPPTVETNSSSPYPENGATNVCTNTPINFDFSERMLPSSFNDETAFVVDAAPADWSDPQELKNWTFGPSYDFAMVRPNTALNPFTSYNVRLYGGDPENDFAGSATDFCGNPIDGNADGTAKGDPIDNFFGNLPEEAESPIQWETGDNADCTPVVTGFNPTSDYYGEYQGLGDGEACTLNSECASNTCSDGGFCEGNGSTSLQIDGLNFLPHPIVQLDGSLVLAEDGFNSCFDDDHLGNVLTNTSVGDICLYDANVSLNEIDLNTPVGAGDSAIVVEVAGEESEPSENELDILSPYIATVDPPDGSIGQFITISGENFGTSAGTVMMRSEDGIRESTLSLPDSCGDVWADDEIVAVTPETYTDTVTGETGTWESGDVAYVQVINQATGRYSDLQYFEFNDVVRPNLCEIVPNCSEGAPASFTAVGENFGNTQGGSEVAFAYDSNTGWEATVSSWGDAQIQGDTHPDMIQEEYWVTVYDASTGLNSNGRSYDIPCSAGPQVVTNNQCNAAESIYPVPNPQPNEQNACLNAGLAVLFDQEMNFSTLNGSNIFLQQYNAGSTFDPSYSPLPVGLTSFVPYNAQGNFGFQSTIAQTQIDADQDGSPDGPTSGNLQSNTWYQLTITTGVQNTLGVGMASPYIIRFKTDNTTELCDVTEVDIAPASATLNSYLDEFDNVNSETYTASPYAGCQLLNSSSYSWDWSVDDTNIGNFGAGPGNTSTQPVYVTGDGPTNVGSTDVTAEANSISDSGEFEVDLGFCESDADCASCSTSSCVDNRCTPVVNGISPIDGDHGTWVTINGCMFGANPGTVNWNTETISAETEWPDVAQCSTTWSANQIVAEVPEEYDSNGDGSRDTALPETAYTPQVVTQYDQAANSPQEFTLNTTERPGICALEPAEGPEGEEVSVYGQNLGTTPGFSSFLGDADLLPPSGQTDRISSTIVPGWADDEVNSQVPTGAVSGLAPGEDGYKVIIAGGDEQCVNDAFCSNPLDFAVSCEVNSECSSGCCDPSGICLPASACTSCVVDADCDADGMCTGSTCSNGQCTPVINDVQQDQGPLGGPVTISGCYFGSQGAASAVAVNGQEAQILCGPSGWSNEQIIAEIPETGIPIGDDADFQVTTQFTTTAELADAYTVLNECAPGIPVPASGVPVLCDLLPATGSPAFDGDPGDTVSFTGENFEAGQTHLFSEARPGDNSAVAGPTASTSEVPEDATSGPVEAQVLSCPSNPLEFAVACSSVDECAAGDFCIEGICTPEPEGCTPGNDLAECGPGAACVLGGSGEYMCVNRPTLLSAYPANGQSNVCTNGLYTLVFSEEMVNYDEITITVFEIDPATGARTEVDDWEGDNFVSTIDATSGEHTLEFTPEIDLLTQYGAADPLDINNYEFTLTIPGVTDGSAVDVVSSAFSITLAEGTVENTYTLSTNTCAPDTIDLNNAVSGGPNHTFSGPAQSVPFTAVMLASDGQPLQPVDDMGWEYTWDPYFNENSCANVAWVDITAAEDAAAGAAGTQETQSVISGEENGANTTLQVTATPTSGSNWSGTLNTTGLLTTYLCDSGEIWEYVDDPADPDFATRANGNSNAQFFRFLYCDDDTLPTLNEPIVNTATPVDDWFLQYLFINPDSQEEAIGVRVYANGDNLSPFQWYQQNAPNAEGASEITIDGYQAVRDGNSYYISASNVVTSDPAGAPYPLYNNIYLITFSEEEGIQSLANQIVENLLFNTNVSYASCEGSDKQKLVRDTKRVSDLGTLASLADTYRDNHTDAYPLPQSENFGSYLQEITTSGWNSWQGALGNLFNQTLPTDPYNFFYSATQDDPWEASATPWIDPDRDNIRNTPLSTSTFYDCEPNPDGNEFWDEAGTCWDPVSSLFFCPQNSHVYAYKRDPSNPQDALFYAHLEYESSTTQTYLQNSTTFNACAAVSSGQNAICDCFNYGVQSPATTGTPWTVF